MIQHYTSAQTVKDPTSALNNVSQIVFNWITWTYWRLRAVCECRQEMLYFLNTQSDQILKIPVALVLPRTTKANLGKIQQQSNDSSA